MLLGMEFTKGERVEGGFALVRPKGNNSSFMTSARAFTQEVLPLKNLMISLVKFVLILILLF